MREVTAIMGWFVEVKILVSDEESPEHIKERLAHRAAQEMYSFDKVTGPDVIEASEEGLEDK